MSDDDQDLSFADLGGAKRHNTAPAEESGLRKQANCPDLLERETGFELLEGSAFSPSAWEAWKAVGTGQHLLCRLPEAS